jgi:thiosulfate/3-mercaptopyruvate sulfurtransferase
MKDEGGKNRTGRLCVLSVYLAGAWLASGSAFASEPPDAVRLARGQHIYTLQCAGCHGDDGEATFRGENTKILPGIHVRRTDFEIGHRFRGFMATLFTEEERADLVAFVKSLKGKKGYERPELLISGTGLAPFVTDPGVRIVDLRSAEAYAASHLPNAVHLDAAALDPLPPAEAFARLMTALGVGDNTYVVAYDDDGGRSAALLWAALQEYGHERVSVLDGGWGAWVREDRYVTPWKPSKRAVTFTPRPRTFQYIADAPAGKNRALIIDAGRIPRRVPAAPHVPWVQNLQEDGTFRPAADLRAMYAHAGITGGRAILTTGQDIPDAAQMLFVLRLLGFPEVRAAGSGARRLSLRE